MLHSVMYVVCTHLGTGHTIALIGDALHLYSAGDWFKSELHFSGLYRNILWPTVSVKW
jgi:hypothetical protein